MRTTEIDVAPLLELPSVREYADRHDVPPEEAVLPMLRELAVLLASSDRLIVDAALSLELLRATPLDGVDLDSFYAADLGERREYLTKRWPQLHEPLSSRPDPPALTVRTLRGSRERRAFAALADLIVTGRVPGEDEVYGGSEATEPIVLEMDSRPERARVLVVGDAVIDHIWRTDRMPSEGLAVRGRFQEHIGGKALNRAVAAARLGLEVSLLTAIGNDEAGSRIRATLRRERVASQLLKVMRAPTPVAGVIITKSGGTSMIGRDDEQVRLTPDDLAAPEVKKALTEADVVMLTFEQPLEVIEQSLNMIRELPQRPLLLVQPAPPLSWPQRLIPHLDIIDFMIGTRVELAGLLRPFSVAKPSVTEEEFDHDVVPQLLALNVTTICAIEGFTCSVRSDRLTQDIPRSPSVVLDDSPGTQAAFVAALAYRLVTRSRTPDHTDFEWATAAMAATQSFGGVPGAMPDKAAIDRIAKLTSSNGDKQ
ncbi:PfkB family carbohydrate kinase [Nocardia sp. NPDC052566]|uniref:PfkB family carbohydrate kinase n=1 Tax=Nocardia sp. NPDC052566 TaxID=3364330 RepID=UPI0037C5E3EE